MRRNVVFDRGRSLPRRGPQIGEYGPQESSEASDAYYGPGDNYARRNFTSGGYSREEQPLGPTSLRPGGKVGHFAPERHPSHRIYGEVRSYGELHPGGQSWKDLGVSSTHAGEHGITDQPLQSFRGRGPRGHTRTDERLTEMICDLFTDDPYVDASDITVEVKSGEVSLMGTVPDRPSKWRAEDLAESCSGVATVNNRLRTRRGR
jgi:hypothetical protein